MEKRRPHYPLKDVKAAFASPKKLNRTFSAAQGAEALGFDDNAAIAVISALTLKDFDKSMTSHADARVWQDVYKPMAGRQALYVKFTLDARKQLLLISFKEADA